MPGPLSERVRETVAEIEPGRMPSLAISPPAAHRTGGQVRIDGHDVDLGVTEEPVDNVLPGRACSRYKTVIRPTAPPMRRTGVMLMMTSERPVIGNWQGRYVGR